MPRVIVLEPSALDVSAATEFGSIEYVSESRMNFSNIDNIISQTIHYLKDIKYNPLEDYICLTGQGQKLAIFVATVSCVHKEFLLLIFDARQSKYKKRVFRHEN